jgi:hypothetical protein
VYNRWVISPQRAKRWEEAWKFCSSNGVISLGWNDLGDVSHLSELQLKRRIKQTYSKKKPGSRDYIFRSLWDFYHSVKPGDRVVVSHGRTKIAAVGSVIKKAFFERNKNIEAVPDDPYSNHIGIRWDEKHERTAGSRLGRQAIYRIEEQKFQTLINRLRAQGLKKPAVMVDGKPLRHHDEEVRYAILKEQTVEYQQRHNTMTKALGRLFRGHKLKYGDKQHCRYDVLIENYDGDGKDLLIEAKPDPGKGEIRVAIGQLYDYRRFLMRKDLTDLALLTISSPSNDYLELLAELNISSLWFPDGSCKKLDGSGSVWTKVSSSAE